MDSTANQWILNVLHPLREVLPVWPAVLPSRIGDLIRPLKIGAREDFLELLGPPPSDAHRVLIRVLRRYAGSDRYQRALNAPDSWRHALDGTPVEPVAEEHKVWRGAPVRPDKEVFVVAVETKAIKVTVVLEGNVLRSAPPGAPVAIEVKTAGGISARANLNPKSYRKAVEAIRQHGPENVAVVLQGRMVTPGEILDAGITVQERKKPAAEPEAAPAPAPATPSRPGQLTLKKTG